LITITLKGSYTFTGTKTKIEYVRNLKDLYDISKSYPTWPFNTAILRKFISTTATPILAMLPIIVRIILIKKFGI